MSQFNPTNNGKHKEISLRKYSHQYFFKINVN